MKTYLVTGGAGFIGSNFIIYMLNKYNNIKIINLDKLTYAGNLKNLSSIKDESNYIFIKGDICDEKLVTEIFKQYEIDYVVNFAAESHVDKSIKEPQIFIKTNVVGTTTLLNATKYAWEFEGKFKTGKRFLQISTDEVYGSLGDKGYFVEDTPLNPRNPYSASKAAADFIILSYYNTYKMPVNITRCSNNYGAYQFREKFIPLIIYNCLNNKQIPLYGDGLNVRDWLYVEEHCRAIDMVIQKGRTGEVYNIGGNNEITNIELIKIIINYINKNYDSSVTEKLITYVEDRKGHDRRYAINSSKIKKELNWKQKITFEEGIKKTIQWYLNNPEIF